MPTLDNPGTKQNKLYYNFKLEDIVYVLVHNKIYKGEIVSVNLSKNKNGVFIQYVVSRKSMEDSTVNSNETHEEYELFHSKSELYQSLENNLVI